MSTRLMGLLDPPYISWDPAWCDGKCLVFETHYFWVWTPPPPLTLSITLTVLRRLAKPQFLQPKNETKLSHLLIHLNGICIKSQAHSRCSSSSGLHYYFFFFLLVRAGHVHPYALALFLALSELSTSHFWGIYMPDDPHFTWTLVLILT